MGQSRSLPPSLIHLLPTPAPPTRPTRQHIAPELAAADVNDLPVLKADALKFATTFRSQLPKATALATFPHLVKCAGGVGGLQRPSSIVWGSEYVFTF